MPKDPLATFAKGKIDPLKFLPLSLHDDTGAIDSSPAEAMRSSMKRRQAASNDQFRLL